MKISCKKPKLGSGTEISVYIPYSATANIPFANPESTAKGIRIKKKFPKNLSFKQCDAVSIVLGEIYRNYHFYYTTWTTMGLQGLQEQIRHAEAVAQTLDSYQFESLGMLLREFCIPVAFEKASTAVADDCAPYLEYDNTLSVALIGSFGYGKTTLLKELLNFDPAHRFLLVDGGRTTLCTTYVRAYLIDKNNRIHVPSGEVELDAETEMLYSEYQYQNHIKLYTAQQAYDIVIVAALAKAFDLYRKALEDGILDHPSTFINILKSFCQDERFVLDSIFGEIPDHLDTTCGFYGKIIEEFSKTQEPDVDTPDFVSNQELRDAFYVVYERTLQEISKNFPQDALSVIERENEIEVSFSADYTVFSGLIDTYYRPFTDNTVKGGSMRVFVKQIYLETYMDGQNYDRYDGGLCNLPALMDGEHMKFHSFLFVDTVGVGHVKKSGNTPDSLIGTMNYDIIANQGILSGVDVILLLDKATDSMRGDVLSQIYSLESLGLIDKVILVYSYYNQFIKQDMNSDTHREEILLDLFSKTLTSLYPSENLEMISAKAKRIFASFVEDRQAIVFLKGLVPRRKPEKLDQNAVRRSSRRVDAVSSNMNAEDEKAEVLNQGIENSTECLGELVVKMIERQEVFQKRCRERASIVSHYSEYDFQRIYTNAVDNCLTSQYVDYESDIYLKNTPHYNTTGALCRNAVYDGKAVHLGTTCRLAPVDEYLGIAQDLISRYLDDTVETALEILRDIDGSSYDMALNTAQNHSSPLDHFAVFLGAEIKKRIAPKIRMFLETMMVSACRQDWLRMANDCGTGVKYRRATAIHSLVTGIASTRTFQTKIMTITMDTIQEVVADYSI